MKDLIGSVPELKEKPDEQGWSPIHISAAFGHLHLVKWFSVTGVSLTKETPTGYTAIHLAAMNGHVNCIMVYHELHYYLLDFSFFLFCSSHLDNVLTSEQNVSV